MGQETNPRLLWLDETTARALAELARRDACTKTDALRDAVAALPRLGDADIGAMVRDGQRTRGRGWQYLSWRRDDATVARLEATARQTGLSQAAILRYAIRRAANGHAS